MIKQFLIAACEVLWGSVGFCEVLWVQNIYSKAVELTDRLDYRISLIHKALTYNTLVNEL